MKNLEILKNGRSIWRKMTGDGSGNLSLYFWYSSYTFSFCGSNTQSRRRITTKGSITLPYSDGLNKPLRMSSAEDHISDDIDEVDCK